jgi:hypothetical protein
MADGKSASISYEVAPTIDEILRECNRAWETAQMIRGEYDINDETRDTVDDEVYIIMADRFRELNQTYPIIIAVMSTGSYNEKVARKFFKYVREHPWKTDEEFYDIQSVYSAMIYRFTNSRRHVSRAEIDAIREQTRESLNQFGEESRKHMERVKKIAEDNNKKRAQARARDLLNNIATARAIIINAESRPIVVHVDE